MGTHRGPAAIGELILRNRESSGLLPGGSSEGTNQVAAPVDTEQAYSTCTPLDRLALLQPIIWDPFRCRGLNLLVISFPGFCKKLILRHCETRHGGTGEPLAHGSGYQCHPGPLLSGLKHQSPSCCQCWQLTAPC